MAKKAKPDKKAKLTVEDHRKLARNHEAMADIHRASASRHRAMATLKSPPPKKGDVGYY
jgi:hypothetical protein